MKLRTVLWVVALLGLVALSIAAESDYEYEDAPAAPVKPSPVRSSPLLRTARGPAVGRPSPKTAANQKTTTTEPPPPEYEDEEGEEEFAEEEEQEQVVTTTTEAPKKGGVKTGVVRPFRSNADLIERLKKRREQHQKGSSLGSAPTATTITSSPPSSEKSFGKNGRKGTGGNRIPADQASSTSERKSSTVNGNRRFGGRGGKTTEAPPEPEVEEEQPRPKTFGRGRRF